MIKTILAPYSVLSQLVYNIVDQPQRVFFSIFDVIEEGKEEEDSLVQYPDLESTEPVIPGLVRLVINNKEYSPNLVLSENISDPTWKDILNICNDLLGKCQTYSTGFLYDVIPGPEGVYELALMK